MIVQNKGLVFQPLVLGFANIYSGESGITDVTAVGGIWNCFGTGRLPSSDSNGKDKTSWYEIDPIAGISVGIAKKLRSLRDGGRRNDQVARERAVNSRLDEMQAALLRVKLKRLAAWTEARRRIAARYRAALAGAPLELPSEAPEARHVYHLFTVRHSQRDALAKTLADRGVGTAIYYPGTVPDQPVFAGAEGRWPEARRAVREVLSLPCFAELSDDEIDTVAATVRDVCERL